MSRSSYSESWTGIVKWFGTVDEYSGQTEITCVIPSRVRKSSERAVDKLDTSWITGHPIPNEKGSLAFQCRSDRRGHCPRCRHFAFGINSTMGVTATSDKVTVIYDKY
jgi:hypothetical protein